MAAMTRQREIGKEQLVRKFGIPMSLAEMHRAISLQQKEEVIPWVGAAQQAALLLFALPLGLAPLVSCM